MTSNTEQVLAFVRGQILRGERQPGERISEAGIAGEMGISRTPARTALAALEAEGLIGKRQGRGYTVRSISISDITKTVEVRATLEALAARTLAGHGMSAEVEQTLLRSIETTQDLLERDTDEARGIDFIGGYTDANIVFHETIMRNCGNELIAHTYERIAMLPYAALGTLAFERADFKRERMRLTVGHSQHVIIFDALRQGDAQRAEAIMREHSSATLNYTDLFVKKDFSGTGCDNRS